MIQFGLDGQWVCFSTYYVSKVIQCRINIGPSSRMCVLHWPIEGYHDLLIGLPLGGIMVHSSLNPSVSHDNNKMTWTSLGLDARSERCPFYQIHPTLALDLVPL